MSVGRPRLLSVARENRVVKLYQGGMSARSLARQFGTTPTTICATLRRQGIEPRQQAGAIKAAKEGKLRKCVDCGILKLPTEFYRSHQYLFNFCKDCYKVRYAHLAPTYEQMRDKQLWSSFRIRSTDYEKMLKRQKGKCAICGKKNGLPVLAVDHDHKCCSGRKSCGECLRGLLCSKCNRLLGLAEDNVSLLRAAIKYLESFDAV
jgi:hypothetical protein